MTDDVCELVVTAPDVEWLVAFGRQLVIDHLASSVHNLAPIRSVYEWRGQLYDRTEARAGIHTRTDLVPFIIERLDHEHPYEVPGVFALPIVATSSASQSWIVEQTTPRR
jgi:periplasmic divalent cation tolerance protein